LRPRQLHQCGLRHRGAAVAPRAGDPDEPRAELAPAHVALVVTAELDRGVHAAVRTACTQPAHPRSGAGQAGTSAPCSPPSSLRLIPAPAPAKPAPPLLVRLRRAYGS